MLDTTDSGRDGTRLLLRRTSRSGEGDEVPVLQQWGKWIDNNVRESREGAPTLRRSCCGRSWQLGCQQQVFYPQHLLTQELSTSAYEPRALQSRHSRTPAGCQLRQSHLRSHKANDVLQVWFFLGGPRSRDGFDQTVDSQGESCPFHPWDVTDQPMLKHLHRYCRHLCLPLPPSHFPHRVFSSPDRMSPNYALSEGVLGTLLFWS